MDFMDRVRVLVADDHAIVRSGICNALKELPGLEVVAEVGDGPSLSAALAQEQPDCLIVDVAMPDFEPVTAIQQIRADYPNMSILVISAHDDDVYVQGLLRAGVNGYHLKGKPLAELRLALERVLAGERWVSSPLVERLISYTDSPSSPLTARQRDVLRLLHEGLDNQTIARRLDLSVKTIEHHLTCLYRQIDVHSRLEAVNYVIQHPDILALSGQEAARATAPPDIAAKDRLNVLLVDDNARYRRRLQRTIGKVHPRATIYEATNTAEATQLAQRVAPQLILVDVILDEEDGIRCTRRIKAMSPKSRVILISAYPDREFHRRGLEAGAVAFLDKKDLNAATFRQIFDDLA
jgi:DNA-binding NarL/FixJ family response regulator